MKTTKCECGAITVSIDGIDYSMRPATFKKTFGKTPPRKATLYNCNHCVNHWGTDLCGCGSGRKFGKCDMHLSECRTPMQSIEDRRECVRARGAW
jgi:hypothetical protein